MNNDPTIAPRIPSRVGATSAECPSGRLHRQSQRPRPEAGTRTEGTLVCEPRTVQPIGAFTSVLCASDRSAHGRAAHDQAMLLAAPEAALELVPGPELTQHGSRALHDACQGYDLLALGADTAALVAVEHAPISVLLARWCPLGTHVTDTILVPVDDSPESGRAVALAGRIVANHGGTITILAAPPRDPALQRAIAASGRVLLELTGAAPRRFSEQLPREHAIPSAACALTASLVVLGSGSSEPARRMTAQIAGSLGCSVLAVPALEPIPERRFVRGAQPRSGS